MRTAAVAPFFGEQAVTSSCIFVKEHGAVLDMEHPEKKTTLLDVSLPLALLIAIFILVWAGWTPMIDHINSHVSSRYHNFHKIIGTDRRHFAQ
ncbi:hypothetical protein [Phyllobacterium sp. CCNWLW183]|uniref:hypothetical protein n=1 Tax=Phyllobacterium sp. CCNWLW183 TaxID=3127482 RepID=UPI003076A150